MPPSSIFFYFKLNDSSSTPSFFHSMTFPRLKLSLSQPLLYFLPLAGGVTWPSNSPKPIILLSPSTALSVLTLAESDVNFDRLLDNEFREAIEAFPYLPELIVFDSIVSSLALLALLGNLLHELTPYLDRTTIHDTEALESACLNFWLTTTVPDTDHSNPRSLRLMPNLEVKPNNLFEPRFSCTVMPSTSLKKLFCIIISVRKNLIYPHVLTCTCVFVCLLKAQRVDRYRKVCIGFSVDCQSRLNPQVPPNYFGNCILPNCIIEEAGVFLKENGVAITVEKLSDVMNGLENDLLQRAKETIAIVHHMGLEVLGLRVARWPRIGFEGTDFGWGPIGKVEITHLDKTNGFSITEIRDGREGVEIGVVLTRSELECFVSQFDNGLKAIQSRL